MGTRKYGTMTGYDDAIKWVKALDVKDTDMRDRVVERMRYEFDKSLPIAPRFIKGMYGKKYDSYQCGQCGYTVTPPDWEYCPRCGTAITDFDCGRRLTQKEQAEKFKRVGKDVDA